MSPDDMLALAEHDEHMAEWCRAARDERAHGVLVAAMTEIIFMHQESARYWREKSRENA